MNITIIDKLFLIITSFTACVHISNAEEYSSLDVPHQQNDCLRSYKNKLPDCAIIIKPRKNPHLITEPEVVNDKGVIANS